MDADAFDSALAHAAEVELLAAIDAAPALREDLRAYTLTAIEGLLGPEALAAVHREQRLPALVRTRAIAQGCCGRTGVEFAYAVKAPNETSAKAAKDVGEASAENADRINVSDVRLANLTRLFMLGDRLNDEDIAAALPATCANGDVDAVVHSGRALFQIVPASIPRHLTIFRGSPVPGSEQDLVPGRERGQATEHEHRLMAGGERADVLIASDWGELAGVIPGQSHVMPVGGATRTLAAMAAYGVGERVLDVGTGCGYHAILAALCGARVTATDVSARALAYARLNAALAGVTIDFRCGSLLDPVRERYDVVVSNPPFVITPEAARTRGVRTYRDGGREGDSLLAELVGGLGEVLAPGGRAWLLGNWEIGGSRAPEGSVSVRSAPEDLGRDNSDCNLSNPDRSVPDHSGPDVVSDLSKPDRSGSDDSVSDRSVANLSCPDWACGPAAWIPEGLDAWVIQREVLAPPNYAEMWLRDGGQTPRDHGYEEAYAAWLEDFARRGVSGVGMGYIAVRAPQRYAPGQAGHDGPPGMADPRSLWRPWRRFEELSGPAPADLHGYLEGVWAQHDLLCADDSALLEARLICRAIEHRLHAPGQAEPFMLKLAQIGGFAVEVQVTGSVAGVVGACDGELPLGSLCDAVAQLLGEPADDVQAEVLPAVRELIGLGILSGS
jgi:ribosomal protein L11 methyltransferase (prmA)